MNLAASRTCHRLSCEGPPASNTGYMCNGEAEQSHSSEARTSEAPVRCSLGGHPKCQGHQAAQKRVHSPFQAAAACDLSDRWLYGKCLNASKTCA